MERFQKYVNVGANVAVIAVLVLLIYFISYRYFFIDAKPVEGNRLTIPIGERLEISDIDFSKSQRNLVLVLSTSCRFCTESLPFYRKLAAIQTTRKDFRMVGAFIQDVRLATKYLEEYDFVLDEVVMIAIPESVVSGTPTLILVDNHGKVMNSWYGMLKPEKEEEIVSVITNSVRDKLTQVFETAPLLKTNR